MKRLVTLAFDLPLFTIVFLLARSKMLVIEHVTLVVHLVAVATRPHCGPIFGLLHAFFYKNNFIRTRVKLCQKLRTIQAGIWNHTCKKFTFLYKILLFSSNSTVSYFETLQLLRSLGLPLRIIWLDDQKLGIFGIF